MNNRGPSYFSCLFLLLKKRRRRWICQRQYRYRSRNRAWPEIIKSSSLVGSPNPSREEDVIFCRIPKARDLSRWKYHHCSAWRSILSWLFGSFVTRSRKSRSIDDDAEKNLFSQPWLYFRKVCLIAHPKVSRLFVLFNRCHLICFFHCSYGSRSFY